MFKFIKFEANKFGILTGGQITVGTRADSIAHIIGVLGADEVAVEQALEAFDEENKNYADFGLYGTWTFIMNTDVSVYLPVADKLEIA